MRIRTNWDEASDRDWARVLAQFPLFSQMRKRRVRRLAHRAQFAVFGRGDIVVSRGERPDAFFIILSGEAEARFKPAARKLRVGDYFGEIGLLDNRDRSATVVATTELHVMRLSSEAFLELAEEEPRVALTMLRELGARMRRLEEARTVSSTRAA
jgi:CRP-like cAMP-binding protein